MRVDLRRSKHNIVVLRGRLNRWKVDGIDVALKKARVGVKKHWIKGVGGIFTEASREMVRDLVRFKVASANVDGVVHTVVKGVGIELQDHISARQVGHIVEEGGIASDIQVISEIQAAKGVS